MQRQLLSPDKSIRSQKKNKSIRTQKYRHYDNKHIKSHIYGRDHTHTHTDTHAGTSFQHKSKYYKDLWTDSRQATKVILEECLCPVNSPCSEPFGPVIRRSSRESLSAGWRSCDPWDHWCSRAGSYLGTQTLLPERSKIIHSPKLNPGTLESRHSYWHSSDSTDKSYILLGCSAFNHVVSIFVNQAHCPFITSPSSSVFIQDGFDPFRQHPLLLSIICRNTSISPAPSE